MSDLTDQEDEERAALAAHEAVIRKCKLPEPARSYALEYVRNRTSYAGRRITLGLFVRGEYRDRGEECPVEIGPTLAALDKEFPLAKSPLTKL